MEEDAEAKAQIAGLPEQRRRVAPDGHHPEEEREWCVSDEARAKWPASGITLWVGRYAPVESQKSVVAPRVSEGGQPRHSLRKRFLSDDHYYHYYYDYCK